MKNSTCAIAKTFLIKNTSFIGNKFNLLLIFLLMALICQVNAESFSTTSYGTLSTAINAQSRTTIIEQNNTILVSDQLIGKATGKTRKEIQAIQISPQTQPSTRSITYSYTPEFSIYNAVTLLDNDLDRDGYYQTVSVIFDPDMYSYSGNDLTEVYARLYVREYGGPWIHYYTTDNFIIHSDSEQDSYEVITTFRDGYYPSHYDILIDLYQVGYNSIVATYSADDNASLYALPLESSDYDSIYIERVYSHHGGSFSVLSLLILLLVLVSRFTTSQPR